MSTIGSETYATRIGLLVYQLLALGFMILHHYKARLGSRRIYVSRLTPRFHAGVHRPNFLVQLPRNRLYWYPNAAFLWGLMMVVVLMWNVE